MKTSLLIIDPQNDFCMPGSSLFVENADADMHRLSKFITENANKIDSICVSLDMHLFEDIAHPIYWINKEGKHPEPFTNITVEDVKSGVWKTANPVMESHALHYLEKLQKDKKFTHTIWPYHCIAGTFGANIFPPLYSSLRTWMEKTGKTFSTYIKGMNPTSEQYGIFQSEYGEEEEFNHNLFASIFSNNENVLVAGQAKSHCVATSLKQILDTYPESVKKITLLTDTTSNVTGCEHLADKIYEDLKASGMKENTTENIFKKETV
jgi:nicotinamidase/pyrazinamidase